MLTEEAKELRRQYQRKYREQNRERIREKHRQWSAANKDRVKLYHERYWNNRAAEDDTE